MKTRTLIFDVIGQTLKKSDSCDFSGIISGTSGYLVARFNFSLEWYGCKIAASFWENGEEYAVPVINDECTIPAEALSGSRFEVSLTGINDKYKITSNRLTVFQGV